MDRRLMAAWAAAAILTFVLSLVFMLHGETTETVGPSTYSRSAIGHAGIAAILQRRGLTVIKSRGDSLHKLGKDGLLVIAEPELELMRPALTRARIVLLVLPKWQGQPDRHHHGWIGRADLLPGVVPRAVLETGVSDGKIVRPDGPSVWTHNEIGPAPFVTEPVQLMTSRKLRPVVGAAAGMLVGELHENGRYLWVLSDPDAISNHGLGHGGAPFATALFDALRDGGTVVFDETVHGFDVAPPNPAALLPRQPFASILLLTVVALGLLLWASAARFGAPEKVSPPLKAGKRDLVRNVVDLFRYAGYQPMLVRRYVEETIRDVALRLHAPRGLTDAATIDWLRKLGRGDCAELVARAAGTADLAVLARDTWRWKQEMLNGTIGGADDRGGNPRGGPQGRRRAG